jgi:hypothetical protein
MNTQITDEQVKAWLHEQRNAAGIPSLVLGFLTEYKDDPFVAKITGTSQYYGFGSKLSEAIERLRRQLPDAKAHAKKLREEAARKVAEADAIDAVVPAAVIADKEGRAA